MTTLGLFSGVTSPKYWFDPNLNNKAWFDEELIAYDSSSSIKNLYKGNKIAPDFYYGVREENSMYLGPNSFYDIYYGGGLNRIDSSFLSGKTIQSLTTNFGAVGNDSTENNTAILAGLTWLKGGNGRALYIPAGVYRYSGPLSSYSGLSAARSGCVIYGDGPQVSILKSMDDAGGSVVNGTGNRVIIQSVSNGIFRDFSQIAPNTTARSTSSQAAQGYGLNFTNCADNLVYNVWVLGVAAGHMMFTGGAGPCVRNTVRFCRVGSGGYHPGADGIHFTGAGSADNIVEYSLAEDCGDDGFASIGSGVNTSVGNTFRYNVARNSSVGGAGFSIEGGTGWRCYGNRAENLIGPGIRIASKASWSSGLVDDAYAYNNILINCNTGNVTDRGTICMIASYSYVTGVTLENNIINNPADGRFLWTSGASGTNATSGTVTTVDVIANNNTITGTVPTPFTTGTACTITKSGNTLNGSAV